MNKDIDITNFIKLKISDLKKKIYDLESIIKEDNTDEKKSISEVYINEKTRKEKEREKDIKLFEFYKNYSSSNDLNTYINFQKLLNILSNINENINNINKTLLSKNIVFYDENQKEEINQEEEEEINQKEEEERNQKEVEEKKRKEEERNQKEEEERRLKEEKERNKKEEEEKKRKEEEERNQKEEEEKKRKEEEERKLKEEKERRLKQKEEEERRLKQKEEEERRQKKEEERRQKEEEDIKKEINLIEFKLRTDDNRDLINLKRKIDEINEKINEENKIIKNNTIDVKLREKSNDLKKQQMEIMRKLIEQFKKKKYEIDQNIIKAENLNVINELNMIFNKMFDALAKFIKDYKHNDTIKNYSELYTKEKNKYNNIINKINTENINQRDIEAELYNIYNNIEKYISEINIFYNEKKKEENIRRKEEEEEEKKMRAEEEKSYQNFLQEENKIKNIIKKYIDSFYKHYKLNFEKLHSSIKKDYENMKKNNSINENDKNTYYLLNDFYTKINDGWIEGLKLHRDFLKYQIYNFINSDKMKAIYDQKSPYFQTIIACIYMYEYINNLENMNWDEIIKKKENDEYFKKQLDGKEKTERDLRDQQIISKLENRKKKIADILYKKRLSSIRDVLKKELDEYKKDLNDFVAASSNSEIRDYNENKVIDLNDNLIYTINDNINIMKKVSQESPRRERFEIPFEEIRNYIAGINSNILKNKEIKRNTSFLNKLFKYTSDKDLTIEQRMMKEKEFYDDRDGEKLKRRREKINEIIGKKRGIDFTNYKKDSVELINIMNDIEDEDIRNTLKKYKNEIISILNEEITKKNKIEKIIEILKKDLKSDEKIKKLFI